MQVGYLHTDEASQKESEEKEMTEVKGTDLKQKFIARGKVHSDNLNDSLMVFNKLINTLNAQRIFKDEAAQDTYKLAHEAYLKLRIAFINAWNTKDELKYFIVEDSLAKIIWDMLDYAIKHTEISTHEFEMFD